MAYWDYLLNALGVEDFNNIITHRAGVVESGVSRFGCSSVAKEVRNQDWESKGHQKWHNSGPFLCIIGEAVKEKESGLWG